MDLKVFWATLARRWYLSLLVIAFTIGVTMLVAVKVGPTYEAEGAVLVFPPVTTVQRGSEFTQGNPYLALGGMTQARDIVIRELASKSTADEFEKKYPGSTYQATPDAMNNAPIILVTVDADSAIDAVSGMTSLMARIPKTLTDLQAGLRLDASAQITAKPLTADQTPDAIHKNQIRAAIVAATATLGLGFLIIGLIDGILAARRTRTTAASAGEQPSPSGVHNGKTAGTRIHARPAAGAEAPTVANTAVRGGARLRPRSASAPVATSPTNRGTNTSAEFGGQGSASLRSVDTAPRR